MPLRRDRGREKGRLLDIVLFRFERSGECGTTNNNKGVKYHFREYTKGLHSKDNRDILYYTVRKDLADFAVCN